jgi:uncharacterized protein (DUF433 family)
MSDPTDLANLRADAIHFASRTRSRHAPMELTPGELAALLDWTRATILAFVERRRAAGPRPSADVVDTLWPPRGPCAFCCWSDARHRTWDVIAARYDAGESIDEIAADFAAPTTEHVRVAVACSTLDRQTIAAHVGDRLGLDTERDEHLAVALAICEAVEYCGAAEVDGA